MSRLVSTDINKLYNNILNIKGIEILQTQGSNQHIIDCNAFIDNEERWLRYKTEDIETFNSLIILLITITGLSIK